MQDVTEEVVEAVKRSLHISIQAAPDWAKAWHNWGLFNVNAMEKYSRTDVATANQHVAPAVAAFFKSVSLSQASGSEPLNPVRLCIKIQECRILLSQAVWLPILKLLQTMQCCRGISGTGKKKSIP